MEKRNANGNVNDILPDTLLSSLVESENQMSLSYTCIDMTFNSTLGKIIF